MSEQETQRQSSQQESAERSQPELTYSLGATPGTTYPFNAEDEAELTRLAHQDQLITAGMGGLLPEGLMLPKGGRVLDLACGPGGWAIAVAAAFPTVEVVGVDLSARAVAWATARARECGLNNVRFQTMNIMEALTFPDATFDLINGRFMASFMLPAAWPRLLAECLRLLKPGGTIRLTETEGPLTNSPAFEQLMALATQGLKKAGQSFSPDGRHGGMTPVLARLLRQAGFQDVRLRASAIEWSYGTPAHDSVFQDAIMTLELGRSFYFRLGLASETELARLYQQAIAEMQQEDFCGLWTMLTAWGRKPAEPQSASSQAGAS
ncbi:class I SAM-dependent methyltransferase [Thermogemmatispora sp.]|uniref:class I SAM-dependent methyltransferase n=1 Tax=Thermogemmatispora sp. TaxID=1968838 RepID=UPI001D8B4623|nr:class I SAM-dependent methyltransferase [Thermogemmatispora sp.]MBX5448972.1 methyltransferase domain-containing protein [Thermogemmatispora sp.]